MLSVDNITYGAVNSIPAHFPVWASAGEQALTSALQAGIGLAIGVAVAAAFPAPQRRLPLANGVCGAALIVAAGTLLAVGAATGG